MEISLFFLTFLWSWISIPLLLLGIWYWYLCFKSEYLYSFGRKGDRCDIGMMDKDRLTAMHLFMISMLYIHSVSGADPLDTYCPDPNESPLYTLNSSFHNNLKLLLGSLTSNTASMRGFYNTSVGKGSDRVYGQALCRGDITNSTICRECIEKASQDIMNRCRSEDAMIWYEICQVRYSFQMFISRMVYTGKYPPQNYQEKNVSDPIRFDKVLMYLMNNLSYEAAFDPSKNMFAAGEIDFPGNKKIYGLVQCTRDISRTDCSSCLSSALTDLTACCTYREGGIVVSRNCNVRFELSNFFNVSSAYLLIYPTSRGKAFESDKMHACLHQEKCKF